MTPLEDLERRIAAAFDRIAQAAEHAPAPAPLEDKSEELSALRLALEEERTANAQLEERVRSIREKQETQVMALQAQVDDQKAAMAKLDGALQSLRSAAQVLRDNNQALRAALEQGGADPSLLDQALQAELDSLRADRAAEQAEVAAVFGALAPLLADTAAETEGTQ